eukprot:6058488-Pleurochrysis_carterae.AAC.1
MAGCLKRYHSVARGVGGYNCRGKSVSLRQQGLGVARALDSRLHQAAHFDLRQDATVIAWSVHRDNPRSKVAVRR